MARRGRGEGSIYKERTERGERWVAALTYTDDVGRLRRTRRIAPTQAAARALLDELRGKRAQGRPIDRGQLTVSAFLTDWLETWHRGAVRATTFRRHEGIVRKHLVPALGRHRLDRLTPTHVQAMLNERAAEGLSPRTVAYFRVVLSSALAEAERQGLVQRNASRLARAPRQVQHEVRAITGDEARSLLDALHGDRLEALYLVALSLGLRQGEALGLSWNDINPDPGTLTVRRSLQKERDGSYQLVEPKTGRSRRTIALPDPVVVALGEHRDRQRWERRQAGELWQDSGLVFVDELGQPLHGPTVTRRFQARLAAAGLPRMRFHDLRHAAATLMLAQGIPLRVVMEVLGHSTIAVTANVYAHVMPELQRDAASRMGEFLSSGGDR